MKRNLLTPTFLVTLSLLLCIPTTEAQEVEEGLSHDALFAPNTSFAYFEKCGTLDPTSPDTFSVSNAAMLAQCCLLIYVKEPEFIETTLATAGFSDTQFFDESGTYAFLAESDKHIVIAFRGTETGDKVDYLTDAKFHQEDFTENGTAHAGFIAALQKVETQLTASLKTRLKASPQKTVWVTGHSMGGALATLYCIQNADSVDALYLMGSPRVTGQKLAKHWQGTLPIFRIVNNNDLVARVPAQPFYQHVGPTYFLTADHQLIIDPPFSRAWKERLKGHQKFIKRLISDHWLESDFTAIPSDYFVDHSQLHYAQILCKLALR